MRRASKLLLVLLLGAIGLVSATVQIYHQRQRDSVRPTELYSVIWQQVMSFRAQDYAGAYRQVSTGFQERFNIEAFTDLAHSDYPTLRLADRVEFGAVRWDWPHAVIPAYFFMPDNEVVPYLFSLVQEEGRWKIDGVRMEKRWRAGSRLGGLRS